MQKIAFRYHRFSDKDQSNGSIERQDLITGHWCTNMNVAIIETFCDEGLTARNFDRPDIQKLLECIKKLKVKPDYLVVAELTRFSRELGDAINLVQKIQKLYGVKIVSASRNTIYDCYDHTSFFMMSIEFSLGNVENLKRASDINGGIYTAKAKEGRYIGGNTPYGYTKTGTNVNRVLIIKESEAIIVNFIYSSFLNGLNFISILAEAKKMGFKIKGNSAIQKVLSNPIYCGFQHVKPWKDLPGGLMPVNAPIIIDTVTWHKVQRKLKRPNIKVSLSKELPLKGVLSCHCGRMLTGAPSRNRWGNYYYYYKCQVTSKHNNISAKHAHNQLQDMLHYLSLPSYIIDAVIDNSERLLKENRVNNKASIKQKIAALATIDTYIESVETKFVQGLIDNDVYFRFSNKYRQEAQELKTEIAVLNRTDDELHKLLHTELSKLSNLQNIYNTASLIDQQHLLNLVFDSKLYYSDNTYRTPYLMEIFSHNRLILNEKKLLVLDEKRDFLSKVPLSGNEGTFIEPLAVFLSFIQKIQVA